MSGSAHTNWFLGMLAPTPTNCTRPARRHAPGTLGGTGCPRLTIAQWPLALLLAALTSGSTASLGGRSAPGDASAARGWLVCRQPACRHGCQVQGSNPGTGGSGHRQPLCPADGRPLGTTPRAKCASLTGVQNFFARITTHERSTCQSLSVLAWSCTAPTKSGHVAFS